MLDPLEEMSCDDFSLLMGCCWEIWASASKLCIEIDFELRCWVRYEAKGRY